MVGFPIQEEREAKGGALRMNLKRQKKYGNI
jgi:hypothetical protein